MTVKKLHHLLGEMIAKGHARSMVCIDKPTFRHALEGDGAVILEVVEARPEHVPLCDDDGGIAVRKDGQERSSHAIVLSGGY